MSRSSINQTGLTLIFVSGFLLLLLTGMWQNPSVAQADLPPRPTVEPTATIPPVQNQPADAATINLHVSAIEGDPRLLWSVVQWQDALGDWHDVEGWRGNLEANSSIIWWVAPRDYETGPFRWVVYDRLAIAPLVISESFNLPGSGSERVVVTVVLGD